MAQGMLPHNPLGGPSKASTTGHAVSRSAEFLSCCKTAINIAKASDTGQDNNAWYHAYPNPNQLTLNEGGPLASQDMLEDGLALLRTCEAGLTQLESLVRRRGHTNDPTQEIAVAIQQLQTDAQELAAWIPTVTASRHTRGQQSQKHWSVLQEWFQAAAQRQADKLKEILAVRGTVLQEQAQRVKRLQGKSTTTAKKSSARQPKPTATLDQSLFLAAPKKKKAPAAPPAAPAAAAAPPNGTAAHPYANGHGTQRPATAAATSRPLSSTNGGGYSYYGASGGGVSSGNGNYYSGGGYGGNPSYASAYAGSATGMRHRKQPGMSNDSQQQSQYGSGNNSHDMQAQLMQRQQERQTTQRLQEARQAEKSLAELGTLFGKMSTLITQQSEVMEKVEDDVEAALLDVSAGQQEISTLYSIKKGNRALILKVFGLLIFFIVFMRMYKG